MYPSLAESAAAATPKRPQFTRMVKATVRTPAGDRSTAWPLAFNVSEEVDTAAPNITVDRDNVGHVIQEAGEVETEFEAPLIVRVSGMLSSSSGAAISLEEIEATIVEEVGPGGDEAMAAPAAASSASPGTTTTAPKAALDTGGQDLRKDALVTGGGSGSYNGIHNKTAAAGGRGGGQPVAGNWRIRGPCLC